VMDESKRVGQRGGAAKDNQKAKVKSEPP